MPVASISFFQELSQDPGLYDLQVQNWMQMSIMISRKIVIMSNVMPMMLRILMTIKPMVYVFIEVPESAVLEAVVASCYVLASSNTIVTSSQCDHKQCYTLLATLV